MKLSKAITSLRLTVSLLDSFYFFIYCRKKLGNRWEYLDLDIPDFSIALKLPNNLPTYLNVRRISNACQETLQNKVSGGLLH